VAGAEDVTPAEVEDVPAFGRRRKRVEIVAATALVLVMLAAVGVAALIGRNGGGDSSSDAPTPSRRGATRTSESAAVAPTTVTAATVSPPSTLPTPSLFTVRSSCRGRDCPIAVREVPTTAAGTERSLRTGEVVGVECSIRGEAVEDSDTKQRSDVWYRLADTGGYASALYLEGPPVRDCA
jgi:hypothetical protein